MSTTEVKFKQRLASSSNPQFFIDTLSDTYTEFFLGDEKVICQIAQYVLRFPKTPEIVYAIKEYITGSIRVTSYEIDKEVTVCDVLSWANLTRESYEIDLPKFSSTELKEGELFTPKSTIENISLIEPVVRHHGRWRGRTSQNAGRIRALANQAIAFVLDQAPKQLELHRLANLKKLEMERGSVTPFNIEVTTC